MRQKCRDPKTLSSFLSNRLEFHSDSLREHLTTKCSENDACNKRYFVQISLDTDGTRDNIQSNAYYCVLVSSGFRFLFGSDLDLMSGRLVVMHTYLFVFILLSVVIVTLLAYNNNTNTNTQDDIYSVVYTAPAICESSLWVIWTKVGQRQVAANS